MSTESQSKQEFRVYDFRGASFNKSNWKEIANEKKAQYEGGGKKRAFDRDPIGMAESDVIVVFPIAR